MTNQLEVELRAIQNTIDETRKKCKQGEILDHICVKKIALLRAEEHRILKEIGV